MDKELEKSNPGGNFPTGAENKFSELELIARSKNFRTAIKITVAALVLILVFCTGMLVGIGRERFSQRMSENYFRQFGPAKLLPMDKNLPNPHGPAGQIIKIDGSTLLIKNPRGMEDTILTNKETSFRAGREDIDFEDLKLNDSILVVGSPDSQGQIRATLIRVFNPPF
jgi:hypothetical protein